MKSCLLTFITALTASAGQLSYPVVHTGITKFFDTQKEIAAPDSGDPLFWQDAGRIRNVPSYTDNGDKTVSDNITGIMWEKTPGPKLTYAEAMVKADTLGLGGHTDWRIPTIKELYSLILFTGRVKGQEAITKFIDTVYFDQPLGDVAKGERSIDGQCWSSTHYTGLTMRADTTVFGVNFIDGRIKGYPKYHPRDRSANKMYFRMARGGADYGKNAFSDNGDGTITDKATGLMWQRSDDGTARDWASSLAYCESLELGGFDDWHLPHAKELQSIVDYGRSPMATNAPSIHPLFEVSAINDPDGNPGHYPFYWAGTTHQDGPVPASAAVYIAFGKALGEMNGKLMDVHGAGAQRSDPKTGNEADYPRYHGPQGDVQMVFNHCRCVRDEEGISVNIQESSREARRLQYPGDGRLLFSHPGRTPYPLSLEVTDIQNRIVTTREISGPEQLVIRDHLPAGMYIFRVYGRGALLTGKILIGGLD